VPLSADSPALEIRKQLSANRQDNAESGIVDVPRILAWISRYFGAMSRLRAVLPASGLSYRGQLGEATEGPRGRGQGGSSIEGGG
jgi:hypothetical protein